TRAAMARRRWNRARSSSSRRSISCRRAARAVCSALPWARSGQTFWTTGLVVELDTVIQAFDVQTAMGDDFCEPPLRHGAVAGEAVRSEPRRPQPAYRKP